MQAMAKRLNHDPSSIVTFVTLAQWIDFQFCTAAYGQKGLKQHQFALRQVATCSIVNVS